MSNFLIFLLEAVNTLDTQHCFHSDGWVCSGRRCVNVVGCCILFCLVCLVFAGLLLFFCCYGAHAYLCTFNFNEH